MSMIRDYLDVPFVVASGCITDSKKQIVRYLEAGAGAVVTKTIFRGRVTENHELTRHQAVGTFNTTLYSKHSEAEWVADLTEMYGDNLKVITSIHADNPTNLGLLAANMWVHKAQLFELGIACPTDCSHAILTPELVAQYCHCVRQAVPDAAFLVKLAAVGIDDLHACIAAGVNAGAVGITLSDSLPGVYFSPPSTSPVQAGYSGAGIKPIVQRVIADAMVRFPEVEFVGVGGVETAADIEEYLTIGCAAVQAYSCIAREGVTKIKELTNEIR